MLEAKSCPWVYCNFFGWLDVLCEIFISILIPLFRNLTKVLLTRSISFFAINKGCPINGIAYFPRWSFEISCNSCRGIIHNQINLFACSSHTYAHHHFVWTFFISLSTESWTFQLYLWMISKFLRRKICSFCSHWRLHCH